MLCACVAPVITNQRIPSSALIGPWLNSTWFKSWLVFFYLYFRSVQLHPGQRWCFSQWLVSMFVKLPCRSIETKKKKMPFENGNVWMKNGEMGALIVCHSMFDLASRLAMRCLVYLCNPPEKHWNTNLIVKQNKNQNKTKQKKERKETDGKTEG